MLYTFTNYIWLIKIKYLKHNVPINIVYDHPSWYIGMRKQPFTIVWCEYLGLWLVVLQRLYSSRDYPTGVFLGWCFEHQHLSGSGSLWGVMTGTFAQFTNRCALKTMFLASASECGKITLVCTSNYDEQVLWSGTEISLKGYKRAILFIPTWLDQ